MKGELTINGKDAYATYGISFSEQSIANLMMPPPLKDYVSNTNAGINGKQVLGTPKVAERDVIIEMSITAASRDDLLTKLTAFIEVLKGGSLKIKTKYNSDVYKMLYISCSQLSTFLNRTAVFTLRLNEPNPNDRSE